MNERRSVFAIQVATIAVVLALYQGLSSSGLLYAGVLPSIADIARALVALLAHGSTYANLGVSVAEVAAGFAVGAGAGIAAGIAIGARPWLRSAAGPYLDGLATAPKIIFFPIAILFFGVGPASKAGLGALAAFFPVALTVAAAVRGINPVFVRVGRSYHLSAWQMARSIYVPALIPSIVNGMRIGLGLTIVAVLLGEIKLADRGIGFQAIDAYNHFRIPEMYATLILIFVVAVVANVLIGRLEKRPAAVRSAP